MSVKVVNSGGGTVNVKVETTPTISVSTPEVKVVDVNPVYTSSQPGPSGPAGPAGSDGQGLEPGGDKHQVLKKVDDVDYNTEWGFADRVFISVKFDEAVSAGDPVYVSGYQPGQDVVKVSKADSSDSTKMPAIGLATEDQSHNDFGSVACIGSLYGIDTDDFDVGDVLYVKSGGGLTKDKPTGATNLIQNVGKVGRSQQNNGEIVVMAIGRSNDVPNIADGKIWIGNGSGVATPTTLNAAAIPDFDTEVSNNSSVVANTAKETNVTTNLSFTRDATSVTVTSSDGDDAVLPESSTTQAGVMSAASHQKLANLNASADVTNSSSVEAAGAIMDSDFTSNGLMERTGDGSYDVVAKNTDNISEGSSNFYYTDAKVTTLLGNTNVSALADGSSVILTTTEDVSSASFVDIDNTFAGATNNLVPSQLAVKTYVDNQLGTQNLLLGSVTGTAVTIDISGGGTSVTIPAATTNDAGVMTEAQFDKLAGIEAGADATDAINVAAAGALMDSEVTNLDQVKAFDSSDYATAAQGTAADGALPTTGGTMTGLITFAASQQFDGRDVSDDGNKLDGIESGADVTDATNVANAGAVMNSGNESIDGVKTFTSTISGSINGNAATVTNGVYTTSSVTALSDVSDAGSGIIMSTAERTKLTGIEANATADQTDAEIRAAVEAATDSNVFTDADHSKLNGIEANATADQTAAEIRTLVESASDSNVFTDADHSKLNGIEANATADQTDAEIRAAVESATDSNVFTDDDHTKLNGIQALADVTDSTNVVSSLVDATSITAGDKTSIKSNLGITDPASTSNLSDVSTGGGADGQLLIYDTGTNSYDPATLTPGSNITITNGEGSITIAATSGGIDDVEDDTSPALGGDLNVNGYEITSNTNQNITIAAGTNGDVNIDGDPVNIKHAGSTKLNTTATGVQITGNAVLVDDDEVQLGDTSDLRLFHDSDDEANGTSKIFGKQDLDIISSSNIEISSTSQLEVKHGGDVQIRSVASGGVELYHDGTKKIETASNGVRVSGGVQVTDGYVTRFNGLETDANASLSSAGNHRGADILANFYSTASVDAGKLYNADGINGWELADKDADNTSASLLAIATDDGDAATMITKGIVRVHDIAGTSPSKGKTVYVGDSGIPTVTRPSADGDIVRIIGYVYDETDNVIFFNPSPDFIEVA